LCMAGESECATGCPMTPKSLVVPVMAKPVMVVPP
jgi:hypothetical protein